MLDKSEFFECQCSADEHTIKFYLDTGLENKKRDLPPELYLTVFLNNWYPFYKRIWIAIKYIFGYKCMYGHFDTWMLRREDCARLKILITNFEKLHDEYFKPTVSK